MKIKEPKSEARNDSEFKPSVDVEGLKEITYWHGAPNQPTPRTSINDSPEWLDYKKRLKKYKDSLPEPKYFHDHSRYLEAEEYGHGYDYDLEELHSYFGIIQNELPLASITTGLLEALNYRINQILSLPQSEESERLVRDFKIMLSAIADCLAGPSNWGYFAESGVYLYIKSKESLPDGATKFVFKTYYDEDYPHIDRREVLSPEDVDYEESTGLSSISDFEHPGTLTVLIRPDEKPQRILFEYTSLLPGAASHHRSEGAIKSKNGNIKKFDRQGLSMRLDIDEKMTSGLSLDFGRGYHWSDNLFRNADLAGRLLGETHTDTFHNKMKAEFPSLGHDIIAKINPWFDRPTPPKR